MMRTFMAKLGDFMFSLETAAFQNLDRASSYRWQALERIGRKPAQQFLGAGADTVTLSGSILTTFRGGLGQVGQMRAMAGNGEPLPFVYAFENAGQYCGLWCITSINEKRTVFFDNGMPRKIEFEIQIVEYGADDNAGAKATGLSLSFSQASGAAFGGANASLNSTAAALSSTASKAALGGVNVDTGLALGSKVGEQMGSMAKQVQSTSLSSMTTDAGKLLNAAVPGLGRVAPMVNRLTTAGAALMSATNAAQMSAALLNAVAVARSSSATLGSISKQVNARKGNYDSPGSGGALHRQQAGNIAGAFGDLAGTGTSLGAAAKAAKEVLGV